jgi:hypothetical protein
VSDRFSRDGILMECDEVGEAVVANSVGIRLECDEVCLPELGILVGWTGVGVRKVESDLRILVGGDTCFRGGGRDGEVGKLFGADRVGVRVEYKD